MDFAKRVCTLKHRNNIVDCRHGAVYGIPLSCDKKYIGQMGRCLNARLKEHNYAYSLLTHPGNLAAHCTACKCKASFLGTKALRCPSDQKEKKIIEAFFNHRSEGCISSPSIFLSQKEIEFLKAATITLI